MRGLSCYTASLHGYLADEWDACAILARSVRLAIRVDLPDGQLAFSHHEPSLDQLPDGSFLRYAGAECPAAALAQVAGDLAAHGRVIVVADSASLPWSVTRGGRPAPHWLLINRKIGGRWHVTDTFTALLPAGEQPPCASWLDTRQLSAAMTLPACWQPQQEARNTLAFGSPVDIPPGGALWLRRGPGGPAPACPRGHWLSGSAQVLGFLIGYLTQHSTCSERYLDDIWAAAGHRAFAYRWRLSQDPGRHLRHALQQSLSRWEDLPRVLRIAALSAQRGRPRPTLVRTALEELLQAEEDLL
ncbi:MAG: hypothetical protein ACM3ML_18280 [Micromonosporaceae bacterium]